MKMAVRKMVCLFLAVLVGLVCLSGCSSKSTVSDAAQAHDAQKIQEYYAKHADDPKEEQSISTDLRKSLESAYNDYNAGKIEYDDARMTMRTVDDAGIMDYQEIQEYYTKLEELKASKTAFSEGEWSFEQEKWVESYAKFSAVIDVDSQYSQAQKKAKEAKSNYFSDLYKQVDALASKGDLKSALEKLTTCDSQFTGEATFVAKKKEIESKLEEKVLSDAKAAFGDNKNYEAAIRVLQASGLTSPTVTNEIEKYQSYAPISLTQLDYVRKAQYVKIDPIEDDDAKDVNERSYIEETIIYPYNSGEDANEEEYAIVYYLNSNYSRFTGTVYRPYSSLAFDSKWTRPGYVKIYGDNVLLYSSSSITESTYETYQVDIDVTGVRELKIVVFGTWRERDYGMSFSRPKVCLAEGKLYK